VFTRYIFRIVKITEISDSINNDKRPSFRAIADDMIARMNRRNDWLISGNIWTDNIFKCNNKYCKFVWWQLKY